MEKWAPLMRASVKFAPVMVAFNKVVLLVRFVWLKSALVRSANVNSVLVRLA